MVVTRAAEQSEQLVTELKARGAVPVILSMVAFSPPDDLAPLDEAIRQLGTYDWVFLTSQNALRALRERCAALHLDLRAVFSGLKIAAVGPTTAEAVKRAGLRVAYVASKHQGIALAEELAEEVHGKRVLLPRSDRANPELVDKLRHLRAKVTEICAYKTTRAEKSDADATTVTGEADAVLFFSPSAVHHLRELLGSETFLDLSHRIMFTAIGPVTEQALHQANVERVLLASDTTTHAILETLEGHFAHTAAGLSAGVKPR